MKLLSVNVGLPREVTWHGRSVTTGIFKQPHGGRIALRKLNLDGDRQADLTVHGEEHKAVYCYPVAHYQSWRGELPGRDLPMGSFGENFTVDDWLEESVHQGDQFSPVRAQVAVTLLGAIGAIGGTFGGYQARVVRCLHIPDFAVAGR